MPLAPPPHAVAMKSRKRARQVTTLFHKYTREKDLAERQGADQATIQAIEDKIEAMGGRKTYQEASQLSTSFHSTSKWVLGYLQRNGWLYGRHIGEKVIGDDVCSDISDGKEQVKEEGKEIRETNHTNQTDKKKRRPRRDTTLLEIGAINTELLDAAERTKEEDNSILKGTVSNETTKPNAERIAKKYRLKVRSIDIHSMHPSRIEEADFLTLPLPPPIININNISSNKINDDERESHDDDQTQQQRYDVLVCSMVLNCVTTPEDRGEMITRIYDFLRPGGIAFLTIPKLCLTQSPFVNRDTFIKLLGDTGVGFEVEDITKESPKISFFICHRPGESTAQHHHHHQQQQQPFPVSNRELKFDLRWTKLERIKKGRKYRNKFAVVLKHQRVLTTRGGGKSGA